MFIAGWTLNNEPSQNGIYGAGTQYNLERFATKPNTQLLEAMDSDAAFNINYRIKVFKKVAKVHARASLCNSFDQFLQDYSHQQAAGQPLL